LEHHLRRLADSAVYFGCPATADQIQAHLIERASGFGREPQRVRLLISGSGAVQIEATPFVNPPRAPVVVKLARDPVNSSDIFLYHKTTQRRTYEAAQRSQPDCEDVLLWNERGELTESCVANLVLEINGKLLTPPVDSGLLAGTFRAWLLEQGIIREHVLKTSDLNRCSKIYLVNSLRKWREATVRS
jgi:para-aminobenzoate synthetase/4-amino-4-deoxychorismate lyase